MTEDTRQHYGAEAPREFADSGLLGQNVPSHLRDSNPWGLGSPKRHGHGFATAGSSSAVFHSLDVHSLPPLDKGFAPFDIVPLKSSDGGVLPKSGRSSLTAGEKIALPSADNPLDLWLSRTGVFAAYGFALYFMLTSTPSTEYGASQIQTTAISVNLTSSQVQEALDDVPVDNGAAAPTPIAQNTPEPEPEKKEEVEPPKPDEVIPLASPNADTLPLAPEPKKEEPKKEEEVKKAEEQKQEAPKPVPQNVATTSGAAVVPGQQGRVSASFGELRNYNAAVRAKIARHKPQGVENQGTAVVSFQISASGGLLDCQVTTSSGHKSIDSAAVRAVREASPFSPPPGGEIRAFTIPFKFR